MEFISPRALVRKNGDSYELDVLAYSNRTKKEVYVVETKSRLRDDDIDKMIEKLRKFPKFFPEHRDKALFGVITAIDVTDEMKKKVLEAGLYFAEIDDETFTLKIPKGFKAINFATV